MVALYQEWLELQTLLGIDKVFFHYTHVAPVILEALVRGGRRDSSQSHIDIKLPLVFIAKSKEIYRDRGAIELGHYQWAGQYGRYSV